ncbi:winged helix-turn-helix domain-containing protein (plasmid) [Pseudomonas yamanorum]|nr:winged helix-turn-helix domain-containing protein [Pseudomonas yamanorum]
MSIAISSREARNIAIFSQGLGHDVLSVTDIFSKVGCIQLDPLRAVRESHELVCLSRGATMLEATSLLSSQCANLRFVYPGHALALLPIESWPWFGFLRRRILQYGWRGPTPQPQSIVKIRSMILENFKISSRDFKDGKGEGWARSSSLRIAAEWLLWTGELISTSRAGIHREYSATVNVVPPYILKIETTDSDCFHELVSKAMNALGVASLDDIVDYFRLPKAIVTQCIEQLEFPEVTVEGWNCRAWASPQGLTFASFQAERLVPLSPFDSLIWHRPRLKRLFAKDYLLEAYKPANQRSFGHYFVPVLAGDEIVGRVAPRRVRDQLTIENRECVSGNDNCLIDEAINILISWSAGANYFKGLRL